MKNVAFTKIHFLLCRVIISDRRCIRLFSYRLWHKLWSAVKHSMSIIHNSCQLKSHGLLDSFGYCLMWFANEFPRPLLLYRECLARHCHSGLILTSLDSPSLRPGRRRMTVQECVVTGTVVWDGRRLRRLVTSVGWVYLDGFQQTTQFKIV